MKVASEVTSGKNNSSQKLKPLNIATDLLSAMFVGFVIGFYLDKWMDTRPLYIIVFLLIGAIAGFFMLWKTFYPNAHSAMQAGNMEASKMEASKKASNAQKTGISNHSKK